MSICDNTVSKRLADIARQMEDALLHDHVDRFHELARLRSRDLHTLLDRRREARADPTGSRAIEAEQVERILARAVQEDHHMLQVARQRLGDMRRKIDQLLERQSVHRRLGQRYLKTTGAGRLFSYNG